MDLIEPLPLLEEPEDGEAEPGPPFMPVPDSELSTLTQSRQLRSIPHRDDSSKAVPSELGQRLALRVLRDALTLQLARRGFDGLRSSALNLLAEIAGDFIRALGAELQQLVPAEPATAAAVVPLVLRAQHVVNMRSLADWRHAQATFARQVEPLHGSSAQQLIHQQQPTLGGLPLPPGVADLYAAVRGAWHYKQTHAGRAAHVQAGLMDAPHTGTGSASSADVR